MIILDTNVISEAMRAEPHPSVRDWLNAQTAQSLFITTTSVAELRYRIERLPDGKRKAALWQILDFTMGKLFDTRILPFDRAAAEMSARITARAEAQGKAIGLADGQIAAIAADRQYAVATRDTAPFMAAEIDVIDPWQ
ncbi:type II toxin-antitoxin system VapC family toxin [Pelagibacterium halotolerans]|uniref:type II toxin-antitoxin system VapC family toxin n=1 Tax=Pelagibacterium halotolerans TaxID=531813 RepID=UPI00384CF1BF